MLKKSMALFMVLCMILALVQLPVSAEYSNRWTDNFEENSGSVVSESGQNYISSGENGLFVSPSIVGYASNSSHISIESGMGYNNTTGLYIHCDTTEKVGTGYRPAGVMTRGIVLKENTAAVLRYKVKFLELTTTANTEHVYLSGVTGQNNVNGRHTAAIRVLDGTFAMNKWYTIVTKVSGTTATKTMETYVLDEDGKKASVTPYNTSMTITVAEGNTAATQPVYLWPVYTSYTTPIKRLVLDDVSLTEIYTDGTKNIGFDELSSTIADGEEDVEVNSSFSLAFDSELADTAADTVKLYKATDTEKTSPVECTIGNETFNSFSLTPNSSLDPLTGYVLDFSEVTGAAGQSIADSSKEISFTTEEPAPDVLSSNPANNKTETPLDAKTMTVTFNKEMTSPQTVALTGGSADVTANVTTTDNKTFTFTWENNLDELTTYSVSLVAFKDADDKAPLTTSISFTTEDADIITISDSFEDASLINSDKTGYNGSLIKALASSRPHTDVEEVTQVAGFKSGTNALQFKTGSGDDRTYLGYLISSNEYDFSSNREYFVATWRFKLDKMATYDTANYKYGPQIAIGAACDAQSSSIESSKTATAIQYKDGKPFIKSPRGGDGDGREISENKWYNITYVMGKTGASIYFVDAETNELVYSNNLGHSNRFNSTDYKNYILLMTAPKTQKKADTTQIYNENQTFTIDDVTLWRIKPSLDTQKLATVEQGAERTITPDGALTVEFNQPILADGYDMTLYEVTDNGRKSAYSTATVTYPDFCKQEISFTNLKYGHSYALDCSSLIGVSGAVTDEDYFVEFETSENPDEVSVYDDIKCTGLDAGDTVNFTLTSKTARTVTLVAAFYNRNSIETLEGVQTIEQSLSVGNNDISIPLSKNMQNAEYIRVFAWDGFGTLVPLIEMSEIVAPKKSIKLLMIGTSMTEDTGRFLYDVATAGGLDLDLTVKGVGGSSLSHHAANIEAELAGRTGAEALQLIKEAAAAGEDGPKIAYFTYENGEYISATNDNVVLTNTLKNEQFDVISINQASSGGSSKDTESLSYILGEIRKLQPNAQLILYQTWNGWRSDEVLRRAIFTDDIEPVVREMAEEVPLRVAGITPNNVPVTIIPAGRAFNIADNKYDFFTVKHPVGDDSRPSGALNETEEFVAANGLWRDASHGSYYGCYLAEACWYEFLTGEIAPVVDENGKAVVSKPDAIDADEHIRRLELLRDIAHETMLEYK